MTAKANQATKLYEQGLEAFRAGDNHAAKRLTRRSLAIAEALGDDPLRGQALLGLCRTALRDRDEEYLQELCEKLGLIANRTGDEYWSVVEHHMQAEMARINGQYDTATRSYEKSMQLSESMGLESMVATECLNKSFVSVAQTDLTEARKLLARHFEISVRLDEGDLTPYGLIGLAHLLSAEGNVEGAAEVAFACRQLLKENNIVPDPADEKPLEETVQLVQRSLSKDDISRLKIATEQASCRQLVAKFL